jgi:hypothetical protein
VTDDEPDDVIASRYPPAEITPEEFEGWVAELYGIVASGPVDLQVTPHEVVVGTDGTYDFDATVRFELAGMAFLVLVEAKRHKNPIRRELVASLHSKLLSTGAQNGVMFSTAPFQSGAIGFATVHGIALVQVTEGRFTFGTKSRDRPPALSREEAAQHFGIPTFAGHAVSVGDDGSTHFTMVSSEHPDYLVPTLIGRSEVPDRGD